MHPSHSHGGNVKCSAIRLPPELEDPPHTPHNLVLIHNAYAHTPHHTPPFSLSLTHTPPHSPHGGNVKCSAIRLPPELEDPFQHVMFLELHSQRSTTSECTPLISTRSAQHNRTWRGRDLANRSGDGLRWPQSLT